MALIKTDAMLLLALVVVAAVSLPTGDAATTTDHPGAGAWSWTAKHGGHHHSSQESPLTGLTQCVTGCGTTVTSCFLECYKPLVVVRSGGADPVALPLCLLNCTNNAMICANGCSSNIV